MRKLLFGTPMVVIVLFSISPSARADDEARALIEKAVKAQGLAGVTQMPAGYSAKMKGTMELMGMTLPFSDDLIVHFPSQLKQDIQLEIMGQQIHVVQVMNGDKGWVTAAGNTMDLDQDQLKELKEQNFETEVTMLFPLLTKEKKYQFSLLGEDKVDGKPVVGVKVSKDGRRDVDLFFDKESHMLVKSASRALSPETMQEVPSATFYHDYKETNGYKEAKKIVVQMDGKKFLEVEILESKILDKVDENQFAKP
jgi:hypothetical protein